MTDRVNVEPYWYDENECLGTGTFGEVYKGHHEQNPRQLLAIKRIKKGKMSQSIVDKEIQILQELSAPDVQNVNFVTLVDCVQTEKHVYLVMEYCNGGDLDHYLRDKRKLNEESIRIFLRQIASALKILHDRDIVHRDLKPANILLSHNNGTTNVSDITFKIADFGLGRFIDTDVQAQTFCGTPVYMAPEIFVPNPKYDYKADLWSIGAIVYQCLSGTLFSAFSNAKITFPPNTSKELQNLLTGLLQREPKDRMDFKSFYSDPFIGMRPEDEKKMAKPPPKKIAPAATGATAGGGGGEDPTTPTNRMSWFRRTFTFRVKSGPVKDDKEKMLKDSQALPSQPLALKGQGAGAQNPAQKASPAHYTEETSPRQPVPSAAKGGNIKNPGQQNVPAAKSSNNTPPAPPRRGFFGFCQSNAQALQPIKEATTTKLQKTRVVENRDVFGIAHLDTRFYVLCRSPNAIVSYSDQLPFIQIKEVKLDDVKFPQDIVGCPVSNCLYVTDTGNNSIWKVQPGFVPKVSRWLTDVAPPHTLSVSQNGRVLTFTNRSRSLEVYDPDAKLILRVPLPSEVKHPRHAVETSKGNFVVSHGDDSGKKQGVCEISPKGKVLLRYEHKLEKLNLPVHLGIDGDRVFVLDSGLNRVLQLDSRLKLEQTLPSDDKDKLEKPFRICVTSVKEKKHLLVEHKINTVDIYSLS